MSQPAVDVSGFSSFTTQEELHDFFSFCGKIKSIEYKGDDDEASKTKTAVITFEKPSAARTALMLNGGNLSGNKLTVTSDVEHADNHLDTEEHHRPHIEQSDKPRAAIAAEYLAHGHQLTEDILKRAIDIDNKHGISKKFLSFMSDLDKSVGKKALGPDQTVSGQLQSSFKEAHSRVKGIDEQKGYSKVAREYYAKALASPLGQSVMSFYTKTSKQVRDIHEEALRIKTAKAHQAAAATPTSSASAPAPASSPAATPASPPPAKSESSK